MRKWIVLLASVMMQTVLGGIYAWSTLTPWLGETFGTSKAQSALVFGTTICSFTLVMVFSGQLLVSRGPRFTASIGAMLFSLGYLLASLGGGSFLVLLVSIGFVSGAGIGFGYVVPLSVCLQWFPTHKGLVTGVAVGGFGLGAVLLSACIDFWYQQGIPLSGFFRGYALVTGLLLLICALLLATPMRKAPEKEMLPRKIWTSPAMVLSSLGMFGGTFAGLLVIGNLTGLVMSKAFSHELALVAVMVFSMGNFLGRILWGRIFDHMGSVSIPVSLLLFCFSALLVMGISSGWLLLVLVFLLGFSFGANFVLYAATLSHVFPLAYFSRLYPVCFLFYGVAALLAPTFGGWIADATGSYNLALVLSCVLVFCLALLIFLKRSFIAKSHA